MCYRGLKQILINEMKFQRKVYAILAVLLLWMCIDFQNLISLKELQGENITVGAVDFYLYIMGGTRKFILSDTDRYILPIRWFIIYLTMFYGIISAEKAENNKFQTILMQKNGSRVRYYMQNLVATVGYILTCFVIIWTVILLFQLIFQHHISTQVNREFFERYLGVECFFTDVMWTKEYLIEPMIATIFLALIFKAFLIFLQPYTVYIFWGILLVASSYQCHGLLAGNLLMPVRYQEPELNDIFLWNLALLIIGLLMLLFSIKKIKRKRLM